MCPEFGCDHKDPTSLSAYIIVGIGLYFKSTESFLHTFTAQDSSVTSALLLHLLPALDPHMVALQGGQLDRKIMINTLVSPQCQLTTEAFICLYDLNITKEQDDGGIRQMKHGIKRNDQWWGRDADKRA